MSENHQKFFVILVYVCGLPFLIYGMATRRRWPMVFGGGLVGSATLYAFTKMMIALWAS